MNTAERDALIDAALEGEISEADFLRLEAELHVSPESRQAYYGRLKLSTLLAVEAEEAPTSREPVRPTPAAYSWVSQWGAAAAAAIVVLAVLLARDSRPISEKTASRSEAVASGYAVLANEVNAVWAGGKQFSQGDLVPGGPLELESGFVELELFSGVTVVVEGEASFEVQSPMEMAVTRGKLRADVPPAAHGFRVRTADGDVVDLGTEFALEVTPTATELHVLDGEVEWHPGSTPALNLDTGKALAWKRGGSNATSPGSDPATFVGSEQLASISSRSRGAKAADWLAARNTVTADPRLIAFYPISSPRMRPADRTVPNIAMSTQDLPLDGALVATEEVADRWGMAGEALDFSPAGSRVRVHIPGEFPAMTFFCWARIDSVDRLFNSLFLTDNYQKGEPHWQITEEGKLFLSVRAKSRKWHAHHTYISPRFWNPGMSGQWIQLATVFDPESGFVTHYLNGDILSREAVPEEMYIDTLRIGNASIGNWSDPTRSDPAFAIRNLNGAIDDLMIFASALNAEEIRNLYESSSP